MVDRTDIATNASLVDIERAIASLQSKVSGNPGSFTVKMSSDRRSSYFKDIWCAILVAAGVKSGAALQVVAWGLEDWTRQDREDSFALSYPAIVGLQLGADVLTDGKSPKSLDAPTVRRRISGSGGILGSGARQRTIVELEPELPRALSGPGGRDNFFEFVRDILRTLEIGAMARKSSGPSWERAAKGTILEFLYELYTNAIEHGRAQRNARFFRLQKHVYPNRSLAIRHADNFSELSEYLHAQPERPSGWQFNLVEASVSDFGPGILDGFLATAKGRTYLQARREEVLARLLHEQLSGKSDPNAGLGIPNALAAAFELGAFVSLRTSEFWLVMPGRLNGEPRLTFREGRYSQVPGTHWQLLLPDATHFDEGRRV